ncbi:GNAT family N-acetyltransferase [Facklamia hominis]|uniref:GNAT family N-acetyltransferase n=1 Tax=Facklamia hominis TaxID=178214 RepID=UPI0029D414CB|nr:GNAT family N-acetyltransferase [Facklamia hominis]WPJ90305.1 GNAT family N-acetyltransferase [Facklamia hominis]
MNIRQVDEAIRLIPYYRNDAVSLAWYQDIEICRQVDNQEEPYDLDQLYRMYDYLCSHGQCYYIEYQGSLVGDVSLCEDGEVAIVICKDYQNQGIGRRCIQAMIQLATEQGLSVVKARIYRFNHRSRHLLESLGFVKIAEEWYQLDLPS